MVSLPSSVPIESADAASAAAITDAVYRLASIRSYAFDASLDGGRLLDFRRDEFSDTQIHGVVTHRGSKLSIDAHVAVNKPALFGEEASKAQYRLLIVDGVMWDTSPGKQPKSTGIHPVVIERTLAPEAMLARIVVPFAAGFGAVGDDNRNDVPWVHYRASAAGLAAYADAMLLDGSWTADVWLSREGGYLVGARIHGDPPPNSPDWLRPFRFELGVERANDPSIKVDPSK